MRTLVRHDVQSGVAEVILDRAEAGNAMDRDLLESLDKAVAAITADPRTRAILVWGEGRNFCVGGDIKSFAAKDGASGLMESLVRPLHRAVLRLADHPAPVVVAAQGVSAGAGLGLLAGADLAIAGQSASFSMAYAGIGLTSDGGSSWFLPRAIGRRLTQDLAFTGRRLSAAEAERAGLVSRVVDDEALMEEARALAHRLATGPTAAFGAIKRLLADQGGATLEQHLEAERAAIVSARGWADAQEGVDAFLERRPPRFTGA